MSWKTFFDLLSSKQNDLSDLSYSACLKKYTFAIMKLCIEILELQTRPHYEERRRLVSRNLQYCLYISLVLGMEEHIDKCLQKVVNILASLDCFSASSESFGPLKGIHCFSCLRSSTSWKLRSLELSFQCSGLCNIVTLLISEKFVQSENFSFIIWGRLISYLLKSFWCNYLSCDDPTSYHMEVLVVILLDSLISWTSPKLLQDFCYKPTSIIDFQTAFCFELLLNIVCNKLVVTKSFHECYYLCLLIKDNLGSIVATYLYQRTILEANESTQFIQESLIRLETCLEFCCKIIDCPSCSQLFLSCKISATKFLVQRLCKPASELIFLEKSLDSLAKLTGHCSSCSLISDCFLALIDDLNQRIFLRLKYSLLTRARSLKCLQRLFTFISSELHLFIPKILASLKLVLELEEDLIPVGIETWISFLSNVDPLHAGSHVLTILSVLNPFVPSFPEQLGPSLARLVSQCNFNLFLIIDESYIPIELETQPCFGDFFKNLRIARESLSLQQQMDVLVSFIESPEVSTVKYAVLSRLQKLVTVNRKQITETLTRDLKMRSSISAIISNIFLSLKSLDRKCCILAADILGDLGAIDPVYLMGDITPAETARYMSCRLSNNKSASLESFLQVLLCHYLIPCLKGGEKSGTGLHQNVVGFALQELIRIYINECHQSSAKGTHDLETFYSSELYLSLTQVHRELLIPYIHSSYSVVQTGHKKESLKLDEIIDSKGYSTDALDLWISNLCILLVDTECFLNTKSPWSRVLQVCRNVYRLHPQIARFVFPYILRQFLENLSDREASQSVLDFIDSQLSCALERGSIFASWVLGLVEEYRLIEENVAEQEKVYRLEKICSRLKAFGGEHSSFQRNVLYTFLKSINDVDLAKAALKIGSYHRAVFYIEEHLRHLMNSESSENATFLVRSLQDAHNAIGDKDSLLGLLVLQKKKLSNQLSLQERILEAESLENIDEVNALYSEALSSKCLAGLEISYVKHLLKLNLTEFAKFFARKFSPDLEGTKREQMRALHCAAAWRLSEWFEIDSLDSYSQITGDEVGEICIAAYLNSLSSPKHATHVNNLAKEKIIKSMSDPSLGSYEKSYKFCVYLSILREIEWIKEILGNSEKCRDIEKVSLLHQELTLRLRRTVPDVSVREPIVEARSVCYAFFGDYYYAINAMMELAKLEKENGSLHAAYLNVIRSENMFYSLQNNKDISLLSEIQLEKADIYKEKGNLFSAIETLESVVQALESRSHQSRQENLFSTETQLARALVALGNVSEISHTCTTEVIASYYRKAVNLAANFQDGFYYLARFYDRMLQESTSGLVEDVEKHRKQSLCDKNTSQNIVQCLSVALENYTRTMELGGKYIFESLPRLLTLWFNFEHQACVDKSTPACSFSEDEMATIRSNTERAFENLPVWQWTTCISQILSRISHPSAFVRKNLVQLTARLTVSYCGRMIWYLAPVINGKNDIRRKTGEKIVSVAEELGDQNMCKTLRCGLAFIQELSKICLQSTPKHVKKLSFSSNFEAFKKMLPCNQVVIPTKKAIMISYDESLTDRNESSESAAWSPWNEELPTVYGVEDDIILMNSLMKPKRICLVGSDGNQYYFLCKKEDSGDMRKDSRLMEFASVINRLLRNNQRSRSRELILRTYAVLPLSEECGVIEWLSNLAPLRGIVFHLYNIFKIPISLGEIKEQYEKRTCTTLEFYREWLLARFPALLRHFFVACFLDPSEWFVAKKRFTYSCAVWSMIGYIVGLGDRHGENILIDMTSGDCIHVDFACMFDKGLTLKVPEVVPFRLTPNMLDAMGPAGHEGSFRVAAQITMSIARANRDCLMSVLETFLYDPLVEWEKSGSTRHHSNKGKENIPVERSALKPNAHALKARQNIDEKLQGIVKDSRSPLSIQGQVQRLILEATNEENLANMYLWWMAWI
ncbi:Serine/threonine-protein kinase ATR [Galdieria sulphuraria]|nr:Serine/threonine-protein kinase ATR [Galdieria sulphuraria]